MTELRILTVSALACAALGLAAPAMAQTTDSTTGTDSGASTSTTGSDGMGQMAARNAGDVTCADMAGMDDAVMERTLYYIAGYQRAESDSLNLSDSVSTSSSGTDSSTATGTDTAGGVATGTDTTMGNATADAGSTSGTTSSGSAGGQGMDGSQVDGFFVIPVAQITVKCGEDPSRQVYDVLDEQRTMGDAGNN
jgi:hypothetical protein